MGVKVDSVPNADGSGSRLCPQSPTGCLDIMEHVPQGLGVGVGSQSGSVEVFTSLVRLDMFHKAYDVSCAGYDLHDTLAHWDLTGYLSYPCD